MEIAFQYNDGYSENLFSFANNINTMEGGTHLVGFKTALTRTINQYAIKANLLKGDQGEPDGRGCPGRLGRGDQRQDSRAPV